MNTVNRFDPPRRRRLVTSRTRTMIYQNARTPEGWKGTRRGVKMHIAVIDQPDLENNRVNWRARISRQWEEGKAQDINSAIEQIERAAARVTA